MPSTVAEKLVIPSAVVAEPSSLVLWVIEKSPVMSRTPSRSTVSPITVTWKNLPAGRSSSTVVLPATPGITKVSVTGAGVRLKLMVTLSTEAAGVGMPGIVSAAETLRVPAAPASVSRKAPSPLVTVTMSSAVAPVPVLMVSVTAATATRTTLAPSTVVACSKVKSPVTLWPNMSTTTC